MVKPPTLLTPRQTEAATDLSLFDANGSCISKLSWTCSNQVHANNWYVDFVVCGHMCTQAF
jgi:hypothetical protein